tara:strand:+ start:180 stop:635 length:456 start_codon:yes stop_codon:yes gene_type:complete
MTTQYDPNESYNWIFITTNDDTIIKDLTKHRNFKKIYDDKKCKTTTYGAKGMSTIKGKNIEVDYKTVTSNNIKGNITDRDLTILSEPRDDFKADNTCSSILTDTDLEELEKLIDDIIKKEGGKRKSRKSKKNKSKKARKYRKTRKSKSHKK